MRNARVLGGASAPVTVIAMVVAGAAGAMAAVAGCSVGAGSPDGWRYLRAAQIAVAHPKSWQETGEGAVLRDAWGRTDAVLAVLPADRGSGSLAGVEAVPAGARKDALTLDGHPAQVFNYVRPAPDGRPAAYVDVRVTGRDGRPLLVRAWSVDGTSHDATLLPEIVNSIEFTTGRLP
ncbi:hypothetical protein ACFO3J_14615 [Streptomyces polygonati]|uniref:Lipoprotein n=1 Tax=Streptomyces polygonati TaxID=1617087 RepID=A0ABV8HPK0_9ACTN